MISPQAAASASRHVRSAKNSWDPWWSMAWQMSFLYGTAFSGSKSITSSALTVKLVNDAFQVSDTDSGSVLYTSAAGADHIAIRPNSTLTWF